MNLSTPLRRILLTVLSFSILQTVSLQASPAATDPAISHLTIGKKVWKNECDGTVEGLTSWNKSEAFPSLGIGHFIWYPAGKPGPFEESFPSMIAFLKEQGVRLPKWLTPPVGPCPWPDRRAFMAALNGERLTELRRFLAATVAEQSNYLFERLRLSQAQLTEGLTKEDAAKLRLNFKLLSSSTTGIYGLVDYVNFKGEGTKPSEQYQGHGWGLRQALLAMETPADPVDAPRKFAEATSKVLTQRVNLSPPGRNERQYLPGWLNRTASYAGEETSKAAQPKKTTPPSTVKAN